MVLTGFDGCIWLIAGFWVTFAFVWKRRRLVVGWVLLFFHGWLGSGCGLRGVFLMVWNWFCLLWFGCCLGFVACLFWMFGLMLEVCLTGLFSCGLVQDRFRWLWAGFDGWIWLLSAVLDCFLALLESVGV